MKTRLFEMRLEENKTFIYILQDTNYYRAGDRLNKFLYKSITKRDTNLQFVYAQAFNNKVHNSIHHTRQRNLHQIFYIILKLL